MVRIDIVETENNPTPPPGPVTGINGEVHVGVTGSKAGERGIGAAKRQLETEASIERNGASHVPDGECDGANARDTHAASLAGVAVTGKTPVDGPSKHAAVQARRDVRSTLAQRYGSVTLGHGC